MNKKEKDEIILEERHKFIQLINYIVLEYRKKTNVILLYLDGKIDGIDLLANELKCRLWIDKNE